MRFICEFSESIYVGDFGIRLYFFWNQFTFLRDLLVNFQDQFIHAISVPVYVFFEISLREISM